MPLNNIVIQSAPETIHIENYADAEISSFDYHLEDESFHGKITCLIGFGKPSFEFDFSCKTVEINEN